MSLLRYYVAEARNGLLHEFQYRVTAFIGLIGFLIEPVVYLAVWRSVAIAQGGAVGDYGLSELTGYYIAWSLVRAMNLALAPYTWEWRIRGGRLNEFLIRPVHPFHRDFAFFAGQKPIWIVMALPLAAIMWLTFRPDLTLSLVGILGFSVAIWLAFAIRHMVLFVLGSVNFWTTRTSALFEMIVALELMLSGRLVPMSLMPEWVQRVSYFLPFRWTFQFPIETVIGRLNGGQILTGLGVQIAWIVGLTFLIRVVWGQAIKRYTAVGG
ncbi:MAG: ABC-2 family transporter protein [Acidimicrobiia bacterium]